MASGLSYLHSNKIFIVLNHCKHTFIHLDCTVLCWPLELQNAEYISFLLDHFWINAFVLVVSTMVNKLGFVLGQDAFDTI